jgi:hypothetical protein
VTTATDYGIDLSITTDDLGRSAARLVKFANRMPGAVSQAMSYEANSLAGYIRRGMRSGAPGGQRFQALAPTTVKMKRSSKPLINHGDMLRSVHAEQFERDKYGGSYFVGINRRVKRKDGSSMADLAELHEFGGKPYVIKVTPKLRAFWFAMFRKGIFNAPLKKSTVVINHKGMPKRPFLVPSFNEWKKNAERRLANRVKLLLGL